MSTGSGDSIIAYIGLGSNLGDRVGYLRNAVNAIKHLGDSISMSSLYESEPFGVDDDEQPMYLNMVLSIRTDLTPQQLLRELLNIEQSNGRARHLRYESRTLDLDVLIYGDVVVATSELTIPHPRMTERVFVMLPLSEIAPELTLSNHDSTVSQIANGLGDQGVQRVGTLANPSMKATIKNPA